MKVSALVPWFGSKRALAGRIVEQLGEHRAYFEPFCGSCAIIMAKPPVTMETVNDLHGDLTNLARIIANPKTGAALYRRLRRIPAAQSLWSDSHAIITGQPFQPGPERAYHFFIDSWLGRNGTIGSNGGNNFCVRYTSEGGSPGTRFAAAVDSIIFWSKRMRRVTILQEDGFEIIERMEDKEGTVSYWDPPYLQKGAKYVHDFKPADHRRLADLARRFKKTRLVISYYDDPLLDELYDGFTKVALDHTKAMVQQGRRGQEGATAAPEILLINGPAIDSGLVKTVGLFV